MMSPSTIAHYRITAKLGEGGMGAVYRAIDTKLNREVAIKVLPDSFTNDPERLVRFTREAQVLASLNHPNIAAIYGVEVGALVMELVEGDPLRGPLSLEQALPLLHQLIDALEYAHETGVIHRDLKPSNIKVTGDGRLKVLDFGLAKAVRGEVLRDPSSSSTVTAVFTEAGAVLGTPEYMSPEQARGQCLDKRTDIWSFGAVVYAMVTGRSFFRAPTASESIAAVLTREPDMTGVPPKLRPLLLRCLVRDPRLRLRDISGARILLEETSPPRTAERRWMAATATLALLAIVLLSLLLWSRWHSVPRDDRPLMHLNVDLGPDAVAGVRTTVAISRDGTRIVHPVRGANGTQQLAVRMLDQSKSLILNGTEGGQDAFFAPDGSWIAFSAEGKLKKVPVHGGAVVTVCEAPLMRGGDWGEDGSLVLAAPAVSSGLKLLPGGRADPEFVTKLSAGEITHRWPQLLPGGAILYTAHTGGIEFDNAVIKISDPKTGQQKTIVKNGYYGRFVPSGHLLYMHKNVLFAARFSAAERELQGTPVPMVVDVAGTPLAGSGQYDVASDGTLVYLSGHHQKVAWTIEALEASGKTQPAVAVPGDYIAIALSPDGRHVAYVDSTSNLWTYDITRQSATHLSTDATSPVWAPDGKHIAFGKRTESVSSISWIRSDGAQEAQPIYTSPVSVDPKSFSPDAKSLAIEIFNSGTNTDIAILPLDLSDPAMPKAGKPEMFVHTPSFDGDPAFSPNGRWIAYRSGLFERPEIFVRPYAPGSRQVEGRWQITTRGRGPEWSRDGRHLFYMSGGQIMSVTVTEQGDTIVPEKPVPWSTFRLRSSIAIRSFSVMPDGKRLLVIPAEPAPVENRENSNLHVTFLLNFADELRRKVPVR